MANSRKPGPLNPPMHWCLIPALTPGPLGLFDQGDPNVTTLLGDTPGPLGMNDANDPSMSPFGSAMDHAMFISQDTIRRALENDSDDARAAASAAVKPSSAAWKRTEQSSVPAWNPAAADRVMGNLLANSERFAANKSSPDLLDRIAEQGHAVLDATAEAVGDVGRTLLRAVTIDTPEEARERAERIELLRAQNFRKLLGAELLAHGMIDNGTVCTRQLGPMAVAVQPASAHLAYYDSFDQRIARSTADALEFYASGALINAVAMPILTAGGKLTLRFLSKEAKLSYGLQQELRSSLRADLRPSAKIDGLSPRIGGSKTAELVAPKIAEGGNASWATGNGRVPDSAGVASERGVAFFGRDNLRYYVGDANGATPPLGAPGRPFFMMPIEDSALINTPVSAAIESGFAPSAQRVWNNGGDLFGISVPLEGMSPRLPTAADAMGWPHFLEGGNTAVNVADTDWFLVNKTREFVIDGGAQTPKGTVIFRVGERGELIPLWRY